MLKVKFWNIGPSVSYRTGHVVAFESPEDPHNVTTWRVLNNTSKGWMTEDNLNIECYCSG